MKLGVFAPLVSPAATPDYLSALASGAEDRGLESIWVPEHVVLFGDYDSRYPYSEDGRIPADPDTGWLEPWTSLSFLAAHSHSIRLGTGICILPQRNPVYAAKLISNVDYLSQGRVDVGIGVGWLEEEYAAVDVPFERRGARANAYIEVMRSLWCDSESSIRTEFYELPACRMYPKPVQDPHPPLHIGGESEAAMRRVAMYGQGWFGYQRPPAAAHDGIQALESCLKDAGRVRADVEVTICPGPVKVDADLVRAYEDSGVDRLVVMTATANTDQLQRALDRLVGLRG